MLKNKKFLLDSSGKVQLAILVVVILFAILLSGGFFTYKKSVQPPSQSPSDYTCCDTGDGDNCKLVEDKKFTFRSKEYALIKSDIALLERSGHIEKAQESGPDNKPIFLNTTDSNPLFSHGYPGYETVCKAGDDYYFDQQSHCFGIPNDQIIFLCKSSDDCNQSEGNAKFDAYYRKDDYAIPDFVKNCTKPTQSGLPVPGKQVIVFPTTAESKRTLQLRTFGVKNESFVAPWLSPYCKPAIYLYPKEKTDVNVKITPKGQLTLTIPEYPENGWEVIAFPDGRINSNNSFYNYLYYEAEIPNEFLEKPKEGFVVKYTELSSLFNKLLPDLGLNKKEANEFSEYWLKALPKSNFYFVGIVSKKELDEIAPLDINPVPNNIIRVTLYFEALDNKIDVISPSMPNFKRNGFTVVEWGGLFKRDKNHPFTCLM